MYIQTHHWWVSSVKATSPSSAALTTSRLPYEMHDPTWCYIWLLTTWYNSTVELLTCEVAVIVELSSPSILKLSDGLERHQHTQRTCFSISCCSVRMSTCFYFPEWHSIASVAGSSIPLQFVASILVDLLWTNWFYIVLIPLSRLRTLYMMIRRRPVHLRGLGRVGSAASRICRCRGSTDAGSADLASAEHHP